MEQFLESYGDLPKDLGRHYIDVSAEEMCFVQYMPISLSSSYNLRFSPNLIWTVPLVLSAIKSLDTWFDKYIYLTVHRFHGMGRRGWHSDGFGTDDINFIWYDKLPTEFCYQEFKLSHDHTDSLEQMRQQANPYNVWTFPNFHLLRMDQSSIHRPSEVIASYENPLRTFVKISVSDSQYNLKGNAHNYLLDYNWNMKDRGSDRNHPTK